MNHLLSRIDHWGDLAFDIAADMGKVETGHNTFVNRANARDEQLKGRLSEQNLFVEARLAF